MKVTEHHGGEPVVIPIDSKEYLAAEKAAAVRTFFPDDLRSLDVLRVVDQQRPALPAGEVLCLVKTLCRKYSEGTKILVFIFSE